MTVAAKAVAAAYYGTSPARAYFNGCSTGGRQALTEAQRFPDDYDGIVAGAAANYPTHLQGAQVWTTEITNQSDGYIPPAKYPLIHNAVLEACDALDGVKDRVLEDPRRCHFDPQTIACKGPDQGRDAPTCLTAAQVEVCLLYTSILADRGLDKIRRLVVALTLAAQIPPAATTCESLSSLAIPHTTITGDLVASRIENGKERREFCL